MRNPQTLGKSVCQRWEYIEIHRGLGLWSLLRREQRRWKATFKAVEVLLQGATYTYPLILIFFYCLCYSCYLLRSFVLLFLIYWFLCFCTSAIACVINFYDDRPFCYRFVLFHNHLLIFFHGIRACLEDLDRSKSCFVLWCRLKIESSSYWSLVLFFRHCW